MESKEKNSKNSTQTTKNNYESSKKQNGKNVKDKKNGKGAIIGLTIACSVLAVSTLGLGIAYGMKEGELSSYATQLENVYQKNYYELVDNVNSADTEISKLLNADGSDYQKKLLAEISNTAKNMQNNISNLPIQGEDILASVRFINQLSGYTTTLEEKVAKGETLTSDEHETLEELHQALISMKDNLNKMSNDMRNGYSILIASKEMNGDLNTFSIDFSQIKAIDVDYPTMIYDGPFSDSVVNQKIKGLSGDEISQDKALEKLQSVLDNISTIENQGETNGKFSTYNFKIMTSDNQTLYAQVTKQGGNLLTISGHNDSDIKNIDMANAEKIALNFAEKNGIENAEVVWQEELNDQAYFNVAPVQDGVILYPDLVKVKVDMEYGNVIGYDAISYWTNHTERDLDSAGNVEVSIPSKFTIKNKRLVLAPLDYNREVLCYEYECEKENITYYFYFNAQTGVEENILKVVQTSDSSKLM